MITLEKAIIIKQRYHHHLRHTAPPELIEADNLSIEALKRCRYQRTPGGVITDVYLPGETKESKGGMMITLKKSIEILELNVHEAHKNIPPDVLAALKLMVEAGKRIQKSRLIGYHPQQALLPGETKE